ncbi:MAG: septum formation initiator family protein [Alistipes sp.]|nr:septum formation initiator family protein [Alistipes sp.]
MASNFSKRMWQVLTAVIIIYTAMLTVRNLVRMVKIQSRISLLEDQRDFFQQRISEDSTLLERLNYDEYLEQYAREKFHMQRPNEYIYILED